MLPGEENKTYKVILNNLENLDDVKRILEEWSLLWNFGQTQLEIIGVCTRHNWCSWMTEYDGYQASAEEIKEVRELLRSYGVHVVLLFDKDKITKEECKDPYSNYLIRLFSKWHIIFWNKNSRPLKFHMRRHFKKPKVFESIRDIPSRDIIIFNDDGSVRWGIELEEMKDLPFINIEAYIRWYVKEVTYIPRKKRTMDYIFVNP